MSEDNEVQFVPFHAINQFMIPEYRQEIIQKVLTHLEDLPAERKSQILNLVKPMSDCQVSATARWPRCTSGQGRGANF